MQQAAEDAGGRPGHRRFRSAGRQRPWVFWAIVGLVALFAILTLAARGQSTSEGGSEKVASSKLTAASLASLRLISKWARGNPANSTAAAPPLNDTNAIDSWDAAGPPAPVAPVALPTARAGVDYGPGKKYATLADLMEAEQPSEKADGPETDGLPCRESGYCSYGKLVPYIGEVDSFDGFRRALRASCYKKECIHITIGTNGHLLAMNFGGCWVLGWVAALGGACG